ncbi:MAG: hypothetical protein WC763_06180 [Candidatus Paceibacterota bacterium]
MSRSAYVEAIAVVCTTVLILRYMQLNNASVPSPTLITTGNCSAVVLPTAEGNSTTSFNQVLLVCSTMPGINGTTVSLDGAAIDASSAHIPAEPLNLYEHQKIMFVFIQWTLIIGTIVVAVVLGVLSIVERYTGGVKWCGGPD